MLRKCIVWTLIVLLFIEISCQKNVTEIDDRYDQKNFALICYSSADKSRMVRCATGCVEKSIVSKYRTNGAHSTDYYYRLGCDSETFDDTLNNMKCNRKVRRGRDYSIDYMIKGNDARDARLWVRKTCCFSRLCNNPTGRSQRFWFKKDENIVTLIRGKYQSRQLLPFLVFALVFGLATYAVLSLIRNWLKKKKRAEEGRNCSELEQDIILESEFQESTIIDTKIEVTGRLSIKETAYLLAKLPDLDLVKDSRLKSMSSEESSSLKEKTVVESEVAVDLKKIRTVMLKSPLKSRASGWGHTLLNTVRTISSPYDLLYRMIEHGPYQYPFTALELLSLFEETAFRMAEEPSLLQIDAEITVFGDIRGRYVDLHRWLQLTGWPPENRILFLGGILDSDEPGSVECLALICSLKCRFPKHVFILRGEPETSPFRMSNRLHPIITRAVEGCIKRMCSQMPFAAIIGKSALAVHSGFSPMIREKAHIHHLFRPVTSDNLNAVERHIIFNQPSNKVRMYRPNPKGDGDFFGKQAVKRACRAMRCNVMIRGQSPVPFGYLPCWNNRLINLWSAPGYGSDYGAVLSISRTS
ncbi:unnamed protein product [Caenorhabditis sp. 36 PRJEB53466]|nr:unnamed protein product [Caenorhabditis sp. 36 PRJEB53466]